MTEEEKFLFDLQGYLVIPGAIEKDALGRMNAWLDRQADADPKWTGQTGNDHLEYPVTWGPDFLALLDNPRVLPYLKELMGETLRLDHDYAIFLQPGHQGLTLHGPRTSEPCDPIHFYHCVDGRIYSGLTVAAYALVDVPPDAGGLAVIPGSHKSRMRLPDDIRWLQRESSIVKQVPTRAGDCVIFTEALIHGTLPWKGPGVRRTLFYKYAPGSISWERRTYIPAPQAPGAERLLNELTAQQRRLLMPPAADDYRGND